MGFTIDPSLPHVGQAQEGALMSIKRLKLTGAGFIVSGRGSSGMALGPFPELR